MAEEELIKPTLPEKSDDYQEEVVDTKTGVHKLLRHDGYKSRKFWLSVGMILLTSGLLLYNHTIDQQVWKEVIASIMASFGLSNVAEKWVVGDAAKKLKDSE